MFQYPRADRLIVGAAGTLMPNPKNWRFQYPRADRLIVGAWGQPAPELAWYGFSILVRIDLLLGGQAADLREPGGGMFQYPRADRLIVGGTWSFTAYVGKFTFQYPRADRLIVGEQNACCPVQDKQSFSILVRIDLLLGAVIKPCRSQTS